ncbi:hypothetical protein LSH36_25g02000 [Paralvinella palmiformis]|uniref:Serine/threonine-protein kinase RIO1 n=1 Tax=Paralvinella palmiformis TaxID=53620 RepID=A0AAD9KA92_9ANNE|nr:hypothetical protein LSH36_25g02000 [Paralvinella palmiformis]
MSKYVEGQFDDAEEDFDSPTQENLSHQTEVNTPIQDEKQKEHSSSHHATEWKDNPRDDEDWIDEDVDDYDDDYDDYYDYEWDMNERTGSVSFCKKSSQPNKQNSGNKVVNYQPPDKALGKFANKINLESYHGPSLPDSATNKLTENRRKLDAERYKSKDKSDRATAEQVMDPRTRMILFKLLSRQIISEVNGCISTGKEANVYHAATRSGKHRALKVYKTSILVFKDRDRYVTGEFRFRHGYCKHNPRKMVKTWAEKEMRNLTRIHQSGLRCPMPVILRSHVLVMDFIGHNGWPAPKLKEIDMNESCARELYLQCVLMMRKLYQECKLVHADLSEYNLLYHDNQVYMIDVSQAVEHDHPHALEFLRKDATNITEFFKKKRVCAMTVKELFDFITDLNITSANQDAYLEMVMEIASQRTTEQLSKQQEVEDEVFKHVFIPRTLDDVPHFERDVQRVAKGIDTNLILYQKITGLKQDLSGPEKGNPAQEDSDCEEYQQSDDDDDGDNDESQSQNKNPVNHVTDTSKARERDESPSSKKERKKAVKELQREKRQDKTPKHVKKRREKLAKLKKKH